MVKKLDSDVRFIAKRNRNFKQTDIGLIPEDWEVKALGEVADVCGGKRLPAGEMLTNVPNHYPYIRVLDMRNGSVHMAGIMYVPANIIYVVNNYRVYSYDLLISVAGTLGIIAKIPYVLSGAHFTENANKITNIKIDRDFLYFYLNGSFTQKYIISNSAVGAQPKLGLGRIERLSVVVPIDITEQKAIAKVLSDIDELLSSLEKLIEKKRNIKTATMQLLLTGQKRLAGFEQNKVFKQTDIGLIPEDWEVKALGNIGKFSKGKGIKKSDVSSDHIPCIRYGELYTKHDAIVKRYFSLISRGVAISSTKLNRGDILFACSGETKEEIGKCAAFISDDEVYAGSDIIILSPTTNDSSFLGYLLNCYEIAKQKSALGQGDLIVHISCSALSHILIPIPPLEEQKAIAKVLSDIDTEIEALENRLAKTQNIKKSVMAELLTGQVRLYDKAVESL